MEVIHENAEPNLGSNLKPKTPARKTARVFLPSLELATTLVKLTLKTWGLGGLKF